MPKYFVGLQKVCNFAIAFQGKRVNFNISISKIHIVRGGAVVARWAHNPKVGGSIPSPATEMDLSVGRSFFCARWAHNPKVGGWLIKLASQSTIPSPAT